MQKSTPSILRIFNIHPGEERVVGLLLSQAFLIGLTRLFHETAANTLFLHKFSAAQLPYVYIAAALLLPATGWITTRLQRQLPFARLMLYSLAGYWLVLGGMWSAIAFTDAGWAVFAAIIWAEVGWVLTNLVLWGLAGRLLTVRQGKRLFGFIGAGGGVASILGGLLTPLLASRISVANLLLFPLVTVAMTMVLFTYATRVYAKQVGSELESRSRVRRSQRAVREPISS